MSIPGMLWLCTATVHVYRVAFNLVNSGKPGAGSFQPATCINTPRCWQALWLYGSSFTPLGCGTDMLFIAVSMLFAQVFFYYDVKKDARESTLLNFGCLGLLCQIGVLMHIMLGRRERGEMKIIDFLP